ncbi:DUF3795 domain-containing protein [candidate division WOR-3 bacterium]|nr:DUF3795 domain-containing protein [candidate division WOR-3 bacterium]
MKKTEKSKTLFAKCGNTCSSCPSFKANLKNAEDRSRCSAGWEKYLGIRLSAEKLRACDGCQYPAAEKPTRYLNCRTRKCAVFNGILTCAHCSVFPCEYLPVFESASREKTEARLGERMPDEDYLTFVEPYEWHKHLDTIRASLAPEEIKEMTRVSYVPKTTPFPVNLSEDSHFRDLHGLIAILGSEEDIPYARLDALKDNRDYALRLLWAFGLSGKLEGNNLVIEAGSYSAQKLYSGHSKVVNHYFKFLEGYGVHCEFVPLKEKGWLTPGGALRHKGWFVKMRFSPENGGKSTMHALRDYAAELSKQYGDKAYRHFSNADMNVLGKD